jgi:hypothetical protein
VSDPANYRPVIVLNNLESVFEATVEEQLYAWIEPLIPECQFGFLRKCGTSDHGLLLSSMMISCLERRSQGVLISLDVKGAFDRCWWSKMLARLRRAGMKGRALRLMKDYFRKRFIQVVSGGDKSECRQVFSGVPQGARWSPMLWDLDISDLHMVLSKHALIVCYADDLALWYEETSTNSSDLVDIINEDLRRIGDWGKLNKTEFDPGKTYCMVVSRKQKGRI